LPDRFLEIATEIAGRIIFSKGKICPFPVASRTELSGEMRSRALGP